MQTLTVPAPALDVWLALLVHLSIPHSSLQLTLPFKELCVCVNWQPTNTTDMVSPPPPPTPPTYTSTHIRAAKQFTLSCSAALTLFPAVESLEVQDGLPVF